MFVYNLSADCKPAGTRPPHGRESGCRLSCTCLLAKDQMCSASRRPGACRQVTGYINNQVLILYSRSKNRSYTFQVFQTFATKQKKSSTVYIISVQMGMCILTFLLFSSLLQPWNRCHVTAGQLDWQVLSGCWRLRAGGQLWIHADEHGTITKPNEAHVYAGIYLDVFIVVSRQQGFAAFVVVVWGLCPHHESLSGIYLPFCLTSNLLIFM